MEEANYTLHEVSLSRKNSSCVFCTVCEIRSSPPSRRSTFGILQFVTPVLVIHWPLVDNWITKELLSIIFSRSSCLCIVTTLWSDDCSIVLLTSDRWSNWRSWLRRNWARPLSWSLPRRDLHWDRRERAPTELFTYSNFKERIKLLVKSLIYVYWLAYISSKQFINYILSIVMFRLSSR